MRLTHSLRRTGAAVILGGLAAPAARAAAPSPAPARPAVEALARRLEAAVARVSPSAQTLTGGPDSTQALHVSGIGVVIVLPARALPQQRRQLSVRARARDQQPEAPLPPPAPPRVVNLPASPAPRALEQLELELQRETALRLQLLRAIERAQAGDDTVLRRALELQMLAIREQAEIFRIEVERARARAEREVRVQLDAIGRAAAPAPAPTPSARAGEAAAQEAAAGPAAPAEPPWRVWMGAPTMVAEAHRALVEEVQEAVIGGLEAHGGELGALAPAESVTVAVDFVGAGPFGLRPKVRGTLVVRAGVADLQARAAGTLGPAEFRQRVQARQY